MNWIEITVSKLIQSTHQFRFDDHSIKYDDVQFWMTACDYHHHHHHHFLKWLAIWVPLPNHLSRSYLNLCISTKRSTLKIRHWSFSTMDRYNLCWYCYVQLSYEIVLLFFAHSNLDQDGFLNGCIHLVWTSKRSKRIIKHLNKYQNLATFLVYLFFLVPQLK